MANETKKSKYSRRIYKKYKEYYKRYYKNYYQLHPEIKEYNIPYLKLFYSRQLARLERQLRQYKVPPDLLLDKKVMFQNILSNLDLIQNYLMTINKKKRSEVRKRMIQQLLEKAGEIPEARIYNSYDLKVIEELQKRLKEIDERRNKVKDMLNQVIERRKKIEAITQQLDAKQEWHEAKLQQLNEKYAMLVNELKSLVLERDKIKTELSKISGA